MAWVDGIDGWTEDSTGRRCLYIPAGSKMTLPYSAFQFLNGDGISFEICYKIDNVSDYQENVITIADNPLAAGFRGIRIKPTNITVHSSADNTDTNDLVRGTNLMDEAIVHFVLTIYPNFSGNAGKNLVTGYVNGCKNFQFEYGSGTIWATEGNLVIGAQKSDISLYFIRRYNSVLSAAAVQANFINSCKTIAERTELSELFKSVMDASQTDVSYESVKNNNYNFFVIEMENNASVPSRANGWSKDQKGLSSLEMHYGQHPDWDFKISGVETAGQGTTSMNYYRWNLRWRIDKTSGKKVNVQYLTARRVRSNSYVYDWTEPALQGNVNFDGSGNHPAVKRITAKTNAASSMQSHKIGATRAFTELHNAIGLQNEAQKYAEQNDLPIPAVSVYQYPAYGFVKNGDYYTFIGLFTIGPDKGDKSTFGMDISSTIKENLITMEGTDHSRKMVMFNYPWNSDVQFLASNECLNIVKGANDYDNGWEIGNAHGLGTDEPDDQAAINTVLETEFKPAYNVAFENSTLIIGIPLGDYGNDAAGTLSYINSNISTFQALLDENNRFTYANYQFWIEGEYILYYYDIKDNIYKPNQNLVEQNGTPQGSTVAEQNEWFKAQRRERFKVQSQNYYDIPDTIFHYDFNIIFGAMDNFGKNTYPYKMKTLANGGKFGWWQDDLDSIAGIGNAGADNMPTWMEFQDSNNGSVYFGGSTSVFWNLIHECFMEDYLNTATQAIRPGILSIGRQILEAMSNIAGGTNVYDGVMLYIKQRFWDNAQNYFPQSAYNADAAFKYEAAWLANGQEVAPLTQSLGNHYSAEEFWLRKRVIYMMSFFKAGPFGSYADTSLGQIAFRPQSLQSLTVIPETELYPAFASGQGMVSTARTQAGNPYTFVGPFGVDGQTTHYINASNLLKSLGDLKDLNLGAQYINPIQVQGKKLIVFKIGDAVENVTTNVPGLSFDNTYCLEEIDARNAESITGIVDISNCARLRRAYFNGTSVTQIKLKDGQKIEALYYPDGITNISLRNLKYVTDIQLPEDASGIELIDLINAGVNPYNLLYGAYSSENSALRYINIYDNEEREITHDQLIALRDIANGKNIDGETATYSGVNNDGSPAPTASPAVEGTVSVTSIYNNEIDTLDIISEEDYQTNLKKALSRLFNTNLYIIYNPNTVYISFADPLVESICVANWSSDGVGLTMSDAAAVTNVNTQFVGNTEITSFDEFKYFTGVRVLGRNASSSHLAFNGCTNLTSITLPEGLTEIGGTTGSGNYTNSVAFRNCTSLERINIPTTLDKITGDVNRAHVFDGCTSLSRIDITDLEDYVKTRFSGESSHPFYASTTSQRGLYLNNVLLTDVVIPSGLTYVGDCAFYKNNMLTSVILPSSVTTLYGYAFKGCTSLAEMTFGNAINGSLIGIFQNCSALKKINIPSISAWLGCTWGTGNGAFPAYASGETHLYINGTEVTSVEIPSSITSLKLYAFAYCKGITSVTIPSNVTSIGESAFSNCTGLTGSIVLPSSVTSLGISAFRGCTHITSLTIQSTNALTRQATVTNGCSALSELHFSTTFATSTSNTQWFVGCNSLTKLYCTDFKQYMSILPNQTTAYPDSFPFRANSGTHYIYFNNEEVRDLVIPNTITRIYAGACYRWNRLTSVTIPNSVTEIGQSAFEACSNLTGNLVLPNSVTSIGSSAFQLTLNNTGDSLTIPSSVATLNTSAVVQSCRYGTLRINTNVTKTTNASYIQAKKIIIDGNVSGDNGYHLVDASYPVSVRISGNYQFNVYMHYAGSGVNSNLAFVEVLGQITSGRLFYGNTNTGLASGCIVHLGYTGGLACSLSRLTNTATLAGISRVGKIYVGDGSSEESDNIVLATYLADETWALVSSKLDTWWNYCHSEGANPDYVNSPFDN